MAAARPLLRVCVVGAGSISREFALHHFGPATSTIVSAIVDLDADRAHQLAADVGSVQAGAAIENGGGTRYRAAAAETRGAPVSHSTSLTAATLAGCDVVYIGTTPGAHALLAVEALEAGKHVLLEKPLAATPADADTIVAAAEAALQRGQHVGMNIGMRWNPGLHELRRLAVTEGALGKLQSARLALHFRQWPREWQVQPWCAGRAEGGPLREVGTHFFFGLMELFGHGCVKRVQATVTYPDGAAGVAAESSAYGVLELQNGLSISLSVRTDLGAAEAAEREARGARGDVYELEVVGETGALMLEDFSNLKRTAPAADAGYIVENGSYGRVECVQALVARNGDDIGVGVTARQGRNAQRLLDAILSSEGQWLDVCYD